MQLDTASASVGDFTGGGASSVAADQGTGPGRDARQVERIIEPEEVGEKAWTRIFESAFAGQLAVDTKT
jgi:hypothetical protein